MSMSSSGVDSQEVPVPVKSFSYRDMGAPVPHQANETRHAGPAPEPERAPQPPPGVSPQEVKALLDAARLEVVAQTEARLKTEYEARSMARGGKNPYGSGKFPGGTQGLFFPGGV